MIFQKFSNSSQLFRPPTITVRRVSKEEPKRGRKTDTSITKDHMTRVIQEVVPRSVQGLVEELNVVHDAQNTSDKEVHDLRRRMETQSKNRERSQHPTVAPVAEPRSEPDPRPQVADDKPSDAKVKKNQGIYLKVSPHHIWPLCIKPPGLWIITPFPCSLLLKPNSYNYLSSKKTMVNWRV